MAFTIETLVLSPRGTLGIAPLPGRFNAGLADIATIVKWAPDLVISATEHSEMARHNVEDLQGLLKSCNIAWQGFPIRDFGAPEAALDWPALSKRAHEILDKGGRILAHCYGGQGRSGMILLRLMVERGWEPEAALTALRKIRPGAVETDVQFKWAANPSLC